MRPETKWRPILTGTLKKQALEAVDDISVALQNCSLSDCSLAGGAAGLSLFYHYLARFKQKKKNSELSGKYLGQALQAAQDTPMTPGLYGGFTGIAWTCEHLRANISNSVVDRALLRWLKRSHWKEDSDLISGLAGIGVYGIERLPDRFAAGILKQVVKHLNDLSQSTSKGITWHTNPELLPEWQRAECPDGYFNLGLAHGIPGIVAILGSICAAGIQAKAARNLLDGAFEWMSSQRLAPPSVSMYSSWMGPEIRPEPARAAWCYGDPGIAASLFLAAKCINSKAKEDMALKIARAAAQRTPKDSGVKDAALCHGASGLAHVFNRIFQATGGNTFRKAARFWFQETLKMRSKGKGFGGFSAFRPTDEGKPGWSQEPGFLNGSAGIGLALLAAISHVPPDWDRVLLLSTNALVTPPPAGRTQNPRNAGVTK